MDINEIAADLARALDRAQRARVTATEGEPFAWAYLESAVERAVARLRAQGAAGVRP